ncbi:hypothetical protein [Fulvivirga sediminis]|uniref:Uncharacterized protein n=1 Tax=Fulvivirga sediminis TaxID=2803949 RepID=A0A937F986_9BACT|nr:hypothetical protein [Fulvivirga sediminis]MBL3658817.1 hypothetical protein [Fulvivirga sediminis]
MQNQEDKKRSIIVCVSIIIGTLAFYYLQIFIAKKSADDILQPYIDGDVKIEAVIVTIKISPDQIPSNKLRILKNQYDIIKSKKEHHLKITRLMNAYYFASTLLLVISTIVLGVLLLKVADDGLKTKSNLFKTIFYTVLSLTTFFGVLIQVLDHKENIASNKATYIAYSSTQLKIYNYLTTDGKNDMTNSETINVDKFISSINQEITSINNITFGIEHDRVKDANDIFKNN